MQDLFHHYHFNRLSGRGNWNHPTLTFAIIETLVHPITDNTRGSVRAGITDYRNSLIHDTAARYTLQPIDLWGSVGKLAAPAPALVTVQLQRVTVDVGLAVALPEPPHVLSLQMPDLSQFGLNCDLEEVRSPTQLQQVLGSIVTARVIGELATHRAANGSNFKFLFLKWSNILSIWGLEGRCKGNCAGWIFSTFLYFFYWEGGRHQAVSLQVNIY